MSSIGKRILEEELVELEQLQGLMLEERECLARMDREALLRLTRKKETLAFRIQRLEAERADMEGRDRGSLSKTQGVSELFRTRKALLLELRDLSRTQKEIIDAQREQVGQLLGFLRNLRHPSFTYDNKGTLSRP